MTRHVAVTGCGVVSSLGFGLPAFLDAIAAGRSGVGTVSLFDATTYATRIAAEVRGIEETPAGREPRLMADRKVAFAVEAARQAIEDAFGGASSIPYDAPRRGLSLGVGLEIIRVEDLTRASDASAKLDLALLARNLEGCDPLTSFRIPADVGAQELARRFELCGPRLVNVSACVAGTQAIGQAMRMIRRGFDGMVLCGGTDSMVNPLAVAGFGLLQATTTANDRGARASRPFDRLRDGFVLGEGAAVFVLESLEAAQARGARVHALVEGYGTSLDAYKITDPDEQGLGARESMRRALADARVEPAELGYVNAHGTSTKKNDAVETMAIKSLFGDRAATLPVSSTKSMIGHTISAAGALEFAASLLCFARDLLPPTMHYENPDPQCALDVVPNRAREARVDTWMSNSFGFGGQNASIVARRPA
jgi:3-oxoacyl-[acyl-carrier-protein] synthase II